jgi:hypothetical protein
VQLQTILFKPRPNREQNCTFCLSGLGKNIEIYFRAYIIEIDEQLFVFPSPHFFPLQRNNDSVCLLAFYTFVIINGIEGNTKHIHDRTTCCKQDLGVPILGQSHN